MSLELLTVMRLRIGNSGDILFKNLEISQKLALSNSCENAK